MTISAAGYTAINAIPSTTDQLYVYNDQKGPNLTNIYAFNPSSVRGSSWNVSGVAAMIKGFSYWGDSLSAAIAGYSFQDYDGSAAVIGARHDGTGAGFLGYFNGTTQYGVYTPSTVPARIGGNIEVYGAIMPNGLAGTAGQVLTSAGAGVPATWAAAGSGSGWQLTGNGGTTAGTNFVGTTDLVDLVFKTNGAENMRILNTSGRVGIGTTAPNKKFHVVGDSRFEGYTTLNNNFYHLAESTTSIAYHLAGISPTNLMEFGDFSSPYLTRFNLSSFSATNGLGFFSTAQSYFMYLDGVNGRVGIGTTAPAHRLELSVDDAAKPGGGSWTVASDKRLKQNIKPYTEGLSKLLLVEPIEYNYNERSGYDTKPSYVGVVAQDLQKIAPYMVGKFKKNGEEYLDVNTSAMTYMMVNAIKEQQKMIEDLKKEIEALKKK